MEPVKTTGTIEERRKVWIDALRSGLFQQCRGNVYKNGKFCAIGFASRGLMHAKISVTGEEDYSIYVDHVAQSVEGLKPFCELRRVV